MKNADSATATADIRFYPCVLPTGIDYGPTTVTVCGEQYRIALHSPVPDGAVTDLGTALQTRGSLKREPQGCIRTFETTQLHLAYAWHQLLTQLADLTKW